MLALSRQKDESIVIVPNPNDDKEIAEICVIDIRGDKVRLGISAPTHHRVHSKEVWVAIQKEKEAEENE